ncbi:tetratricopeptide repeat protein [Rufibacter roseolus]|uniref:tetratricopeptide repeat protein n=1 Tax=Rufibacter roseolus TaxID=2817375 RepID=UPI001B30181B|nr:tetratricopeptide repeat protein [Rufibacter roseolus]
MRTAPSFSRRLAAILLLVVYLLPGLPAMAAPASTPLEEAWLKFHDNKRTEARELFKKASLEPGTKAEAHLGLSLLASMDRPGTEAFREFQEFFKASPNPYPYVYSLWTTPSLMAGGGKKTAEQLAFLKNLVKDPKADGTLKAMAWSILGSHYETTNQPAEAHQAYAQIGALDKWMMVGEFENMSGSGFNKDFGPLGKPEANATFTNKHGATVSWFTPPATRNDKWIDFTYHFYFNDATVYAQTFVSSPKDQTVQLRMGVSGSLKAWVNDRLVFADDVERNNDVDTYLTPVSLKKGQNRILVQVGESYAGRSNFMVRLTDEKGNPIQGLTSTAAYQAYTKDTGATPTPITLAVEEFFQKQTQVNPTQVLPKLMLAHTYLRNDKTSDARRVYRQAQKMVPTSSFIVMRQLEAYQREENRTSLTTALEWLKEHDPNLPFSLDLRFDDELEKENYTQALALLDQMEQQQGFDESILTKRIKVLSKKEQFNEVIKLAERGYTNYPENPAFIELKYMIEKNVNKNQAGAANVLKKFLKENRSYAVSQRLASVYFDKGDMNNGIKLYQQYLQEEPVAVGIQHTLGNIYAQAQNHKLAEEAYRKTLQLSPYIGQYWADLAKTLKAQDKKEEALAAYRKAIQLDPTDYTSLKELRQLENKKEVFSYFPQTDVYALIKKAPAAATYPEHSSLVLLDEVQKVVYKGGASEEKRTIVVKTFNQQGVEFWKEYGIDYHNMQRQLLEKAEVVKQNGNKVPAESNNGQLVFTNLEPGDAIHITYKLENHLLGKLASHFWDRHFFTHYLPYQTTRYSLLVDPETKFQYKVTQKALEPKVQTADEFKLYVWEQKDQPGMQPEDKMPVLSDVSQTLYISSFPDWKFISNWYADLAAAKARPDYEVKQAVEEVFVGKQNLTPVQKAQAIYEYITSNITYSSIPFRQSGLVPQKPSDVLSTKIGDCKDVSTLFVAMCREVGVPAQLVLVNTRDNGYDDLVLPSIDFNHCIAKINLPEKEMYVELTSNFLPFGSLYQGMLQSGILEIDDEQSQANRSLSHLNPKVRTQNIIDRNVKVQLVNNGLSVVEENYKTGAMAAEAKQRYRDAGQQERERIVQQAINASMASVKLTELSFKGLEGAQDTVRCRLAYQANDVVTQVGGMSLFSLPWTSKATARDFTFNETRTTPLDLTQLLYADHDRETITMSLPAKKALAEVPQSVKLTCPVAEYSLTYKKVKDQLVFTRELRFTKDIIQPQQMAEFQAFYKKVIAADARQLALK